MTRVRGQRDYRDHRTQLASRVVAATLAGLALSVAGCSSGSTQSPAPPAGSAALPAKAAPRDAIALDPAAFAAAAARPGTVVLDVRTPAEFADGHLAQAVNLDVNSADFRDRLGQLDKNASYAVYCRSGHRSATALAAMADLGFTSAVHLDGGITAWQGAGRPVVR